MSMLYVRSFHTATAAGPAPFECGEKAGTSLNTVGVSTATSNSVFCQRAIRSGVKDFLTVGWERRLRGSADEGDLHFTAPYQHKDSNVDAYDGSSKKKLYQSGYPPESTRYGMICFLFEDMVTDRVVVILSLGPQERPFIWPGVSMIGCSEKRLGIAPRNWHSAGSTRCRNKSNSKCT